MTGLRLGAGVAALLLAACSPSANAPPDIEVSDAWGRATVAGQTATAAYATIANRGAGADRLLAVTSPAAAASLHSSSTIGGVARMRPLTDGLAVPAGATVKLEPAGAHVMLTGLARPLAAGDRIALTLRFERSGTVEVPVRIVEGAAVEGMKGMEH